MTNKISSLPRKAETLPVAVDVCGGDLGVMVNVEGAVQAFQEYGVKSIFVGPRQEIDQCLEALGATDLMPIVDAPEFIGMDESPTRSVRRKPNSSMCVAFRLVEQLQASAVISTGNSGAMMVAGRMICGLVPGIERPAIAAVVPRISSDKNSTANILLDSGANVDCHVHHLIQFAIMGSVYCSCFLSVDKPKIGLLSNGSEASKGTDIIRATARELSKINNLNYIGYIEGRDIATDKADVVVCDGLVGNVALKSMEGCAQLVAQLLKEEAKSGIIKRLGMGLSKGVFDRVFREKLSYSSYGGAPLLGLNRLALVLHGSSGARSVYNAIRMASSFSSSNLVEQIASELGKLDDLQDVAKPYVNSSILPKSISEEEVSTLRAEKTKPGK